MEMDAKNPWGNAEVIKKEGDKRKLIVGLRLQTQAKQGSPAYGQEDNLSRA